MDSPRIDIPREALEEVCRRHHIRRLSLFGSVLRDDFGPQSDVDVLVEFEEGQTPGFGIIEVEEDLSRVFGGRRVDLVNPKYLNRWISKRILASAQPLYAA
ncbi:MAG TPA: nucleotidyltransferase family protein [Planctomycetota bacterium]|nr:nucleotidyltransferase family protein [Planctomycetota bacterium]